MISAHCEIDEIYTYVKASQQLQTLRDEVTELVLQGQTTMEELLKIASYS